MIETNAEEFEALAAAWLESRADNEQSARLGAIVEADPAARDRLLGLADVHAALSVDESLWAAPVAPKDVAAPRRRWSSARVAFAAGLLFGIVPASLALAFPRHKSDPLPGPAADTILQESFESGPAPRVTGEPIQPGFWSGDYTEIVGEQQGVKPASGQRMLRFLRGDSETRPNPSSFSSDVFQMLDVRPFRKDFASGNAVVQLTALFNKAAAAADDSMYGALTIFALNASEVGHADLVLSRDSLAYSRSTRLPLDGDPGTWQRVSNELRVPSGTDYLMIRIGVSNDMRGKRKPTSTFAGHYADQVQMVIAQRPEITTP